MFLMQLESWTMERGLLRLGQEWGMRVEWEQFPSYKLKGFCWHPLAMANVLTTTELTFWRDLKHVKIAKMLNLSICYYNGKKEITEVFNSYISFLYYGPFNLGIILFLNLGWFSEHNLPADSLNDPCAINCGVQRKTQWVACGLIYN